MRDNPPDHTSARKEASAQERAATKRWQSWILAMAGWVHVSAAAHPVSMAFQELPISVSGTTAQGGKTPTKPRNSSKTTTLRSPSEETRSERDRRLTRECRGRPNAGACMGYARP